jgi:hypothetical protein
MKMKTTLGLILAMAGMQFVTQADDLFALNWNGTVTYTTDTGRVISKSYTSRDAVAVIAQNNSLDAKDLVLVYRPNKLDIAVVVRSTGQLIADYLQMPSVPDHAGAYTDVSNTNGTQTVRQAFLFDESHSAPIGSIFGRESQRRNADGDLIAESFHGTFQFAIPDSDPLFAVSPAVFSGTFATGVRIVDRTGAP